MERRCKINSSRYDCVGFSGESGWRRKPLLPYRLLFNARLQTIAQRQMLRRARRMRHGYVTVAYTLRSMKSETRFTYLLTYLPWLLKIPPLLAYVATLLWLAAWRSG